jgi:hypothetical protein
MSPSDSTLQKKSVLACQIRYGKPKSPQQPLTFTFTTGSEAEAFIVIRWSDRMIQYYGLLGACVMGLTVKRLDTVYCLSV